MREWQYLDGGQLGGPVDEAALEAMLAAGLLAPDTPVWTEGAERWATVTDVLRPESESLRREGGSFSPKALAACAAAMAAVMVVPLTLPLGLVGLLLGLRSIREIDDSRATLAPLRGRPVAVAASILGAVEVVLFGLLLLRLS